MNPVWLVASVLVLHPVVEEDTELRMVALGTDQDPVVWRVDGHEAAVTRDGEVARVTVPAGRHEVHAVTDHQGAWEAHVRPDPPPGQGAAYVPAWSAYHPGDEHDGGVGGSAGWTPRPGHLLVALASVGLVVAFWPPRRAPKTP